MFCFYQGLYSVCQVEVDQVGYLEEDPGEKKTVRWGGLEKENLIEIVNFL